MEINQVAERQKDNTTALKWWHFNQNNSGGHFVVDENVSHHVFIQASTAAEAIAVGEKFFDNSDSCPCCGDRWSCWVDDSDGAVMPMIYDQPYTEYVDNFMKDWARLHYFDGRVEVYPPQALALKG